MRSHTWLTVLSAVCAAGVASAADTALERAVGERGQEILRAISADLDGDGKKEVITAALGDQGVALSVWRRVPERKFKLLFASRPYDGEVVLRLQAVQMAADANPELIFEVREVTPDETSRRLIVSRFVKGALVHIFEATFPVGEIKSMGDSDNLLAFGETAAGYRFVDIGKDGKVEIAVRRDVEMIRARRADRSTLGVVVGARETIYRFDAKAGRAGEYVAGRERFYPYVVELPPVGFTGSSQLLPPDLEERFGRAASERGVNKVFTSLTDSDEEAQRAGGTETETGDGAEGDAEEAGEEEAAEEEMVSLQRDPAPMAKWGGDDDLDTSWCEGSTDEGQGHWWQASFGKARTLRMARLIFGDVRTRKTYLRRNEVRGVSLVFSNGERVTFDRKDLSFSSGPLAAIKDLPMTGDRPGTQTMVFFSKPIRADWVRVEIGSVRQRGRDNETCLSEATFYATRGKK